MTATYRTCAFHWCNNTFLLRGSGKNQVVACDSCDDDFRYLHTRNAVGSWFGSWIVSRRHSAKLSGVDFNISSSDLYLAFPKDHCCPILGIPFGEVNSTVQTMSPTIDRIDLNYGYESWNIQIISKRANCMKSDASPENLLAFAKWVNTNYGENNE